MDDLISRSALLQEIDETAEAVEQQNVFEDIKKAFLDALATVREHVVNTSTAYNVNKVMEKINEQPYKQIDVFGVPQPFVSRYQVEKIVKAGGVNE